MSTTDVAAFVGAYPYRHLERHDPAWLVTQMDRLEIARAWVGHLPSFAYRDPAPGNAELARLLAPYADRLVPVPTIHSGLPRWEDDVNRAVAVEAPAIRLYPQFHGLAPAGGEMRVAVAAAAALRLAVVLTVRFEDVRQRHPPDTAGEFPAAAVRALVRSDPDVRLLVVHADRAFIEEVHFGLTPDEAARILWDISWLWGPPEDQLALLLDSVGVERFTLGTGMPLRIPDAAFAKLDLLNDVDAVRDAILGGNLEQWRHA